MRNNEEHEILSCLKSPEETGMNGSLVCYSVWWAALVVSPLLSQEFSAIRSFYCLYCITSKTCLHQRLAALKEERFFLFFFRKIFSHFKTSYYCIFIFLFVFYLLSYFKLIAFLSGVPIKLYLNQDWLGVFQFIHFLSGS